MTPVPPDPYAPTGAWRVVETAAAWCLAILWVLPLAYAVWAAFHPPEFTTRFSLAGAADPRQLRPRLDRGAVRALLPQHLRARHA